MKIADAFAKRKALIPFITCGDPSLDTTEELILALREGGADLIELGIPFSDPTAEGPVIQEANIRSLSVGTTTDKIFDMVRRVRPKVDIPLVFMTYANVVFSYGTERFAEACKDIGISGVILPDVPFEEKREFSDVFDRFGVEMISLVTPVSEQRISMIAGEAQGFVYCVSSLGVTGTRDSITGDIAGMVEKVKSVTNTPAAVGFGISNAEQAAQMARYADGVIIGSAIVKIVSAYGASSPSHVRDFAEGVRKAIDNI